MKKTIILTLFFLAALTAVAFFLLKKTADSGETGEFGTRRSDDQSDQMDEHAFRYDTDVLATELIREGENKNVLNFDETGVFTVSHSEESRDRLDRLIRRMKPSFEEPIIAYNPFGTMPNTYYFYFLTGERCMVKYTITVEDESIPDHIRYVNNGEVKNLTTVHEFTVGGLIPGKMNYIILELLDENGGHREDLTYKVMVPTAEAPAKLEYERGKSELRLQNGLFFLLPKNDKSIYAYDNVGVLRGVLPTESGHGRRIYNNSKHLIYQVSPSRVIRVDRLGQILGMAKFEGYGEILDFSYDNYENVYALVNDGKRYLLVRASMEGSPAETVYKFDKGTVPTSISGVTGGNLYVSTSSPMGLMRIDGLTASKARVGLVIGKKQDWKKTSVKKKVVDPTIEKKKPTDEEGAEGDKGSDTDSAGSDEAAESAEEEAGEETDETAESAEGENTDSGEETAEDSGEAQTAGDGGASPSPQPQKEKPIEGWDMMDTVLSLVSDESNGKIDTLTFAVKKDRLIHAIKLQINGKKKEATLLLDKETEFDGRVLVQWGQRGSCIVANGSRGRYEERDELFKVTRNYSFIREFDGLWKLNLEGMSFYK